MRPLLRGTALRARPKAIAAEPDNLALVAVVGDPQRNRGSPNPKRQRHRDLGEKGRDLPRQRPN